MSNPRHLTLIASVEAPAPLAHPAAAHDALWRKLLDEARCAFDAEPNLRALLRQCILDRDSFEDAVVHRIASRLGNDLLPFGHLVAAFEAGVADAPEIGAGFRADINAVIDRDPACDRFIEPFLYFKGYHAIETHRIAHHLWSQGKQDFALYLQSRSSDLFQTDIHPAARIGHGVFLDHATGFVVGSTAVIEDDVSILQNVTLGGTGKEAGDRHPKVRRGVLIGAGAKILGNIEVGEYARVAAGSVVLHAVPGHTTVAGVPAKIVARHQGEPYREMDQVLGQLAYDSFSYAI
ncbi:serine O-acetyltransferase [Rhodoblastus sphagnicola]|uniref:Serine acetyltransferase n=1 Tax=Rhodoblastus sphagnicola TaxID=333368 RepID=A0A2S6MU22_9HYPH|nr:serine O-acetyltransferase [Rhodoblastus sphagnicola]MBB4199807.1 serine O-acetyltransferase [Rhodoblastus sphagnicola]PPQ25861.1 serine O-acetyltransferase [Rhodoblastus sphagnicola]